MEASQLGGRARKRLADTEEISGSGSPEEMRYVTIFSICR